MHVPYKPEASLATIFARIAFQLLATRCTSVQGKNIELGSPEIIAS
jgi:hypothetical protein